MIIQDLTYKQRKILQFIQKKIRHEGIPPTIREIAQQFGFSSTGTVRDYLNVFIGKGYLKKTPRKSRHIELKKHLGFRIPVVGQVMAGPPDLALEEFGEYLDLDEFSSTPEQPIFCLRIKGDSLIDAGIFEGDLAMVKKQRVAHNGDLIVALIDKEATAKRLRQKGAKIWLEAANKNYPPIHKDFSIIGRVIGIVRKV
ncbi:transcriptional repressor LexA [Candidatus Omnitrophota bacterium]